MSPICLLPNAFCRPQTSGKTRKEREREKGKKDHRSGDGDLTAAAPVYEYLPPASLSVCGTKRICVNSSAL